MKAVVDQEMCIGCGLCCETCDAVFHMNDQDKAEAYRETDAENLDEVQSAIDTCPVSAIHWEE